MTNEEAQMILGEIHFHLMDSNQQIWDKEDLSDAIVMAIEALKDVQNCVRCEHYTEVETDTGIHGECKMDTAHSNADQHVQRVGSVDLISIKEDIEKWRTWSHTYDNLISRQAAVDAIEARHTEQWIDSDVDYNNGLESALCEIKALPSAEPNPLCALADRECPFQGKEFAWCLTCPHISEEDRELVRKAVAEPKTGEWIPVSERLPEQGTVVLICWSGGFITTGCRSGEPEQWLCELDKDNDWCVPVAWMPLPEPYREDSDEE